MLYLGEYEVTLDVKGRFSLPAAFRKQLPDNAEQEGFVLSRGLEECITLYTKQEWNKYASKLERLNEFNPKAQRLKRILLSGATQVETDTAGRILLPKPLQEYAGLDKHIVFAAQGNKVELWDKKRYNDYLKKHVDDLESLANEVLGNEMIDPFE